MRVINSALGKTAGVWGWHKSGKRLYVNINTGGTVTFPLNARPYELREEAKRLQQRALIAESIAYDKEERLWELN